MTRAATVRQQQRSTSYKPTTKVPESRQAPAHFCHARQRALQAGLTAIIHYEIVVAASAAEAANETARSALELVSADWLSMPRSV
jgi:hypothetical protein